MNKIIFEGKLYEIVILSGIWKIYNDCGFLELRSNCSYEDILQYLDDIENSNSPQERIEVLVKQAVKDIYKTR
jgi:hypothetical protein